ALGQRDLSSIAQREIEAHRRNGHHCPLAEDEQAIAVEIHRDENQAGDHGKAERDAQIFFPRGGHTVRSSGRPSSPCGRNRMMTIKSTIGTAARYWVET